MLGLVTGAIWLAAVGAMMNGYNLHLVAFAAIVALLGCCTYATR